jgi:hypothetical protein
MTRAAIRPRDVLTEAARLGVALRPGSEPGRVKLIGPAEAVRSLHPLVMQTDRAELLALLTEQAANDERAATPTRTCRDCQHLTDAGTCTDPVGAGLAPRFCIRWPDPARAASCPAFVERQRPPASAPAVPPEFCDHRDPATDAEIERMARRTEAFQRLGLTPDDVDLAVERLLRRDRDLDGRRLCAECAHLRNDGTHWRCAALRQQIPTAWVTQQLQRCEMFRGVQGLDTPRGGQDD